MSHSQKKTFKVKGYSGFRPENAEPASPTEAVTGEMTAFVADARATKFRRSAVEIIEPNAYTSNSTLTQNNITKAHFMDRPKPVKMKDESNNPSKQFYGVSGSANDYVDFRKQIQAFAEEDPSEYRAIFTQMDTDGSGFLDKQELRAALQRRATTSEYIVDTIMVHFDENADGKVSWPEFQGGLERAKEQLKAAVKPSGKARPSWELKKNTQAKVVSYEERPSMASSDFTEGGFSSHPLTQGTPQSTSHVPGYSGHLPSTTYNPKAVQQASGTSARQDKQNMILIETYNPRVKTFTEVKYGRMKTLNSVNDRLITNHWDSVAAKSNNGQSGK